MNTSRYFFLLSDFCILFLREFCDGDSREMSAKNSFSLNGIPICIWILKRLRHADARNERPRRRNDDGVHRFRNEEPSNRSVRSENARRSPHTSVSHVAVAFTCEKISPAAWPMSDDKADRKFVVVVIVDVVARHRRSIDFAETAKASSNFSLSRRREFRCDATVRVGTDKHRLMGGPYVKSGTCLLRAMSGIFYMTET